MDFVLYAIVALIFWGLVVSPFIGDDTPRPASSTGPFVNCGTDYDPLECDEVPDEYRFGDDTRGDDYELDMRNRKDNYGWQGVLGVSCAVEVAGPVVVVMPASDNIRLALGEDALGYQIGPTPTHLTGLSGPSAAAPRR